MRFVPGLCLTAMLAVLAPAAAAQRVADLPRTASLDELLAQLRTFADAYPPRVKTAEEREAASRLWKEVEKGVLQYLATRSGPDFHGELLAGDIYRMGHNLDLPDASENAIKHLRAAIALQPANPTPRELLGRHLTFIGQASEGLPELLLAYALDDAAGREAALFSLAHNYYFQKNFALALAFAERFNAIRPGIEVIELIRKTSKEALTTAREPKTIEIEQ